MCTKNKNIYAWREQAIIREIVTHDLCCLLPRCEALRTCCSGFPIATVPTIAFVLTRRLFVKLEGSVYFAAKMAAAKDLVEMK